MKQNAVSLMEAQVLQWLEAADSLGLAVWLSLLLNIIISVAGIVPSFFITAANLIFFGFTTGLLLSFLGEALGAIVSFCLYRKGLNSLRRKASSRHRLLKRLQETEGKEAFVLILALRLLPFVPSGIVTLASAGSRVSLLTFAFASSLGKIPALFMEAYSVYHVLNWTLQGKLILGFVSVSMLVIFAIKSRKPLL